MSSALERIEANLDRIIIQNEAFSLGLTSKESDPEKCIELQALLEVCTPEERAEALKWFGRGLILSA
jgi:hypothetical protein